LNPNLQNVNSHLVFNKLDCPNFDDQKKIEGGSLDNQSDKQLLCNDQENLTNPENEIFLLAGDFNIDGIRNKFKTSEKFRNEREFDMSDYISFYESTGELKSTRPIMKEWLENPSRYSVMMALLNSGKLLIDDLQIEMLNSHLVTYGESETNRNTNEIETKESALTDPIDQMSEQGLDYIMIANYYDEKDMENRNTEKGGSYIRQNNSNIRISKLERQEFYVKDKKYTQLSDHLGVEVCLSFKK
jgi:hypothetical protein